ncbi:hypothetical protein RKD31_005038 [Streptomyces sp. SAI-163]
MPALTHGSKTLPVAMVLTGCLSLLVLPGTAHADDILDGNTQNSGTEQSANTDGKGNVSVTVGGVCVRPFEEWEW